MRILLLFKILLFLLSLLCEDVVGLADRKLTAAPKNVLLKRRSIDFEPKFDGQKLHYADEQLTDGTSPMAASILLEPKLPTLILDDVEQYIEHVSCSQEQISIAFQSVSDSIKAFTSWDTGLDLLFITADSSCADEGTHSAYIVSNPSLDDSTRTIVLMAKKTELKEACNKISVDLGSHILPDIETNELRRRIAAPQPQVAPTSSNMQVATASLPVTFNPSAYPTPIGIPSGLSASKDISFSFPDKTLVPPEGDLAPLFDALARPPENVVLKCIDCSLTGAVSLTAAGFTIDTNASNNSILAAVDDFQAIDDFFDSGFFQFDASGISANMAFEIDILPGAEVTVFEGRLPDIPLGALSIQGLIAFGPVLQLHFPIAITANSPVNLQTGFTLDVPPNSNIVLNVSNITASSANGFPDAQLTPLPFSANAENLSLNISVGFQPKLVIGAALFEDLSSGGSTPPTMGSVINSAFYGGVTPRDVETPSGTTKHEHEERQVSPVGVNGGIGVFLDLPKLVATISEVDNTDDHCEPLVSFAINNESHILVEPSVSLAAGIQWDLEVEVFEVAFGREGGVPLFEKSFPLPTQCLKWDAAAKTLVSATSTTNIAAPIATYTGAATALTSGPRGLRDSMFGAVLLGTVAMVVL